MQLKKYNYQSTISFQNVLPHLEQFKSEIKNDVKYIDLPIQLNHSNDSIEVDLCKSAKININSQMILFMRLLRKHCKMLQLHFKKENFSEIIFHYDEISYSEYVKPSSKFNKNILLKSLVKKVNKDKTHH